MHDLPGAGDAKRNKLLAVLSWQYAMGADEVVHADAVDWLTRDNAPPMPISALIKQRATPKQSGTQSDIQPGTVRPSSSVPSGSAAPAAPESTQAQASLTRTFIATAPEAGEASAKEAALAAATLQALRDALAAFDGCGLKATAKNLCFFRGAQQARVMVIGEAPGRDEDRSGVPFIGRAGQLLDKMLKTIGLDDSLVHVTNVVYWRPPGNRTPTAQEVLVCKPFLLRQIDLVSPEIIIVVGGSAAHAILETTQGIMKLRGNWHEISMTNGATVRIMPTLHPAYLLRTPAAKRLVWRDLLAVQDALQAASG